MDPRRFREREHDASEQQPCKAGDRHIPQPKTYEESGRRRIECQKESETGLRVGILAVGDAGEWQEEAAYR